MKFLSCKSHYYNFVPLNYLTKVISTVTTLLETILVQASKKFKIVVNKWFITKKQFPIIFFWTIEHKYQNLRYAINLK